MKVVLRTSQLRELLQLTDEQATDGDCGAFQV